MLSPLTCWGKRCEVKGENIIGIMKKKNRFLNKYITTLIKLVTDDNTKTTAKTKLNKQKPQNFKIFHLNV